MGTAFEHMNHRINQYGLNLIPHDKYVVASICKIWDDIIYPFPKFSGATVEVLEWIINFIPHITGHVITYPCWDSSYSMLSKCFPKKVIIPEDEHVTICAKLL